MIRALLRRWHSLTLSLALAGALLIAAAVALTVSLTLDGVSRHSESMALDQSLAQTRKLARIVSDRLVSRQLDLREWSSRLKAMPAASLDASTAKRFLSQLPGTAHEFDSVFIARPSGEVLARLDARGSATPTLSIADRAYFQQTLALARPVISEALIGRASSAPLVMLTMPVTGQDGRIEAVLGGAVLLGVNRVMQEVVADQDDDPGRSAIVDTQGHLLAHPEARWLMRDVSSEPVLGAAYAKWIDQGRPIDPAGVTLRVGGRLVSLVGIPVADWLLLRSQAESTVLGGIQTARRQAMWLGTAVAVVGGLLLSLGVYWLLRPLRQLERAARALARGDQPPISAWPSSAGEIGRLADLLRQAHTQQTKSEAEGRRLLALLQAVMTNSPVGLALTRNRNFEMVNRHYEELLGYAPGALIGQPARTVSSSQAFYEELGPRVAAAFGRREPFNEEFKLVRRDGSTFWGRMQGQPVDWNNADAGTIWALDDVTEQRAQREDLTWASTHDALTRLTNRAEFERLLAQACADRREHEAALLYIDLDRFKAVNDGGGHAAGDEMLIAVARALGREVRHGDVVGRIGGDEFAVLLPACNTEGAVHVAEKIRSAVSALRLPWAGQNYSVGASVGVVMLDASLPDATAAMATADAACYAAKRSGRDAVRLHASAVKLRSV